MWFTDRKRINQERIKTYQKACQKYKGERIFEDMEATAQHFLYISKGIFNSFAQVTHTAIDNYLLYFCLAKFHFDYNRSNLPRILSKLSGNEKLFLRLF